MTFWPTFLKIEFQIIGSETKISIVADNGLIRLVFDYLINRHNTSIYPKHWDNFSLPNSPPTLVAQSDAGPTGDPEVAGSIPSGSAASLLTLYRYVLHGLKV